MVESLGAIWVWHDPEGGEPEWAHPSLPQWDDPSWVRGHWDHLGMLNQHPRSRGGQHRVDYGHLSPIHGSTVERYENEFKGHNAIQRQCGGHRTLVGSDPANSTLYTDTVYHGPGVVDGIGVQIAVGRISHQRAVTRTGRRWRCGPWLVL